MQRIKYKRKDGVTANAQGALEIRGEPPSATWEECELASYALSKIDQFVRGIEKDDEMGFVMKPSPNGAIPKRWLELAKNYYRDIGRLQVLFSAMPVYSLRVQVFFEACAQLEIIDDRDFGTRAPHCVHGATGKTYAELFNELIAEIRRVCHSPWFKKQLKYRKGRSESNEIKALAFEEAMFEWRSRHLVIVLHCSYQDEYREIVTEEMLRKHRDRFFNNRRSNRLLNQIDGVIWVIEQGEKSGLHMHLILFYSPRYRHDVLIAKALGEYWVRVATRGLGQYRNGNARKKFYEEKGYGDGTGTINRGDLKKRTALRKTIHYFTKDEQTLLSKTGEHVRTFGTSQVPEKSNLGRPRKQMEYCEELDLVGADASDSL